MGRPQRQTNPSVKPVKGTLDTPKMLVDEDDKPLPDGTFFYIDGYQFGDRVLEGVKFKASLEKKGTVLIVHGSDSDAYLSDLNAPMWMDSAWDYLSTTDSVTDQFGRADWYLVDNI